MFKKTPLEDWIYSKITGQHTRAKPFTRAMLEDFQLEKLKATVCRAKEKSPFYRHHLKGFAADKMRTLADLKNLPFTEASDIRKKGLQLTCVPQSSISRVVSLKSSGTSGAVKRIYFTREDQELTKDFFACGMSVLAEPGDRVLILLPSKRPGSVGQLLAEGLKRLKVHALPLGPARGVEETLKIMREEKINILVAAPVPVLALARFKAPEKISAIKLKSLLLSTDHVPAALVRALEKIWQGTVYNHYGMTEMGFGGGVECAARTGYHLREADLYFEIIDPLTGAPLPEGEEGEVVFTTLTRQGMPLVRYRTGDLSRFIPAPCPCGTVLKRLEKIKDRLEGRLILSQGGTLSMADLDEALFKIEGVLDFKAALFNEAGTDWLQVTLKVTSWAKKETLRAAEESILALPVLKEALKHKTFTLAPLELSEEDLPFKGTKRLLTDRRF